MANIALLNLPCPHLGNVASHVDKRQTIATDYGRVIPSCTVRIPRWGNDDQDPLPGRAGRDVEATAIDAALLATHRVRPQVVQTWRPRRLQTRRRGVVVR